MGINNNTVADTQRRQHSRKNFVRLFGSRCLSGSLPVLMRISLERSSFGFPHPDWPVVFWYSLLAQLWAITIATPGSRHHRRPQVAAAIEAFLRRSISGPLLDKHRGDGADGVFIFFAERPSAPGQPIVLPRDGRGSLLAYQNKPDDALVIQWQAPETDGGTPINGTAPKNDAKINEK